jgi:hypothetical protein
MRVLVVPEDPTHDQHVIKPVVEKILEDCGRRGVVEVLRDPHLRGVDEALDSRVVAQIVRDNPMVDVFLIVVDRDCDRMGNEAKAAQREAEHSTVLLTCLAIQELEVWALALWRDQIDASWAEVRASCDPKEEFFDPFIDMKGWGSLLGKGRKRAMRELAGNWAGMKAVCPEIQSLSNRLQALIAAQMLA